ncbi:hypothetical protein [Mycolicibacterium sp.]|uniref:hypothetical protein n=1 Tax=Mycolicibacterium sp. TaxID=2320850 RepID=UPI003D0E732F
MARHAARSSIYAPLRVLIYSSDANLRLRIRQVLGRYPDTAMAPLDFVDTATAPAVVQEMAAERIDLAILDAEASPAGGLGLAKQLRDELLQHTPIVVIIARADDNWLTAWARADAVVTQPIRPVALLDAVLPLLRTRLVG